MKKATAIGMALLVASVVATVLPGAGGVTRAATTTTVSVQDNQFNLATVTITAGDTIQWNWTGSNPHTVSSTGAESFDSGAPQTVGSFLHTFSTIGSFGYMCAVHGSAMSGTVIVLPAAATNTPTSTPTATSTVLATNTPASVTPTTAPAETPAPTSTAAASVTATPAGAITQPAATATRAAGAAGAQLPRTGSGGSGGASMSWLNIALAVVGFVVLGAALAARRRA